jgi:hypothetical protein
MISTAAGHLRCDTVDVPRVFNREPFGFSHDLGRDELFADDSLRALARSYDARDAFVAASAASPGTPFYAVDHGELAAHDALERLDALQVRVLLKRPETYDPRFRRLLDALLEEVLALRGGLRGERIVRLESALFVSSAAAITPFHFDPEITFFFQIAGEKTYHVFSPRAVAEDELERFYVKGIVNVGQLDLASRDADAEHVFDLVPGRGFHQPQNAPHWVSAGPERSVSYTISFETDRMRAANRTRSFNHYERLVGLRPALPGAQPAIDRIKARAMDIVIPARKALRRGARAAFGR